MPLACSSTSNDCANSPTSSSSFASEKDTSIASMSRTPRSRQRGAQLGDVIRILRRGRQLRADVPREPVAGRDFEYAREQRIRLGRLVQIEVTERRAVEQRRVVRRQLERPVQQRLRASRIVRLQVDLCDGFEQLRIRRRDLDRALGGGEAFGSPPQRHQDLRALELQCRVLAVPRERRRDDVERPGEVRARLFLLGGEQRGSNVPTVEVFTAAL